MAKVIKPIEVPPELKSKVNNVKSRILFLSPSVTSGLERECRRDDFESLANSNIGVGGFGKVYKVRHKVSQSIYAIKVINKAKIIEHDLVEQIKLEVEIMYKLNHPYVVKLYNHYEDDDSFYLILEYAPKGQIYTLIKREGRFSERVSAQYLREVISACQYLHSLDPPIIHRDIKPENILLDADGAVKLADFGWSNFFNEDHQKRQTYCGTPEYLAPEMIKQSGHDKSLDIWNLGVLLFELLTGSPPFEGSNQSILFDNILNHKVKWPTRFNALAKDLIQKLLKTNPSERIKLDEIVEHPWFKSNPPIRTVHTVSGAAQPSLVGTQIKSNDYKVISATSPIIEKKQEPRQSLLEQKLDQIKNAAQEKDQNSDLLVKEITSKLTISKQEVQDLKTQLQIKQNDLDRLNKEKNDLQMELSTKKGFSNVAEKDIEIKKLQEELSVQRSLNKNREQLLTELDQKNSALRQAETQLKLTKNDLVLSEQQNKSLVEKSTRIQNKVEELEKKLTAQKEQVFALEKQKEQNTIESEAKILFLNQKLLTNLGQSAMTSLEVSTSEHAAQHVQFMELLNMCRTDIGEILTKVQHQLVLESAESDKLRTELINQGKQMNESKLNYEKRLNQLRADLQKDFQTELKQIKMNLESSTVQFEQQLNQKDLKIKILEKAEKRQMIEREKGLALEEQVRQLQERTKNIQTDRDLLEQEKRMVQELLKFKDTSIKTLEEKLSEHNLAI